MTGDLNIARYIKLRYFSDGPKYRTPVAYSWHQNFDSIMDACEGYARRWAKKKDVDVDTLSDWIKSIADVLKCRIRDLNTLSTPDMSPDSVTLVLSEDFPVSMTILSQSPQNHGRTIQKLYICLQDTLRQHLDRGTGTLLTPWKPYIQYHEYFAPEVLENH